MLAILIYKSVRMEDGVSLFMVITIISAAVTKITMAKGVRMVRKINNS